MTINTETIRDAAEVLDTLTSKLPPDHPFRAEAASRAKERVDLIYAAADEIDRLREAAQMLADWAEHEVGAEPDLTPGLAEVRAALSGEEK